MPLLSTSAFMP